MDAFHSTLEEAASADVILNVVDASSPACEEHIRVTEQLLTELGASEVPVVTIFNKCDRLTADEPLPSRPNSVRISARSGLGLAALEQAIEDALPRDRVHCIYLFPYSDLSPAADIRSDGTVYSEEYTDAGLRMDVLSSIRMAGKYEEFLVEREV